jgi:hypothetical protein
MIVEKKNANPAPVGGVQEFYTDDTVAALNAALSERGVEADRIISVLNVPGQGMGQPVPPRLRVLYRSH